MSIGFCFECAGLGAKSNMDANQIMYDFFSLHRLPKSIALASQDLSLIEDADLSTFERHYPPKDKLPVALLVVLAILALVAVLALKAPLSRQYAQLPSRRGQLLDWLANVPEWSKKAQVGTLCESKNIEELYPFDVVFALCFSWWDWGGNRRALWCGTEQATLWGREDMSIWCLFKHDFWEWGLASCKEMRKSCKTTIELLALEQSLELSIKKSLEGKCEKCRLVKAVPWGTAPGPSYCTGDLWKGCGTANGACGHQALPEDLKIWEDLKISQGFVEGLARHFPSFDCKLVSLKAKAHRKVWDSHGCWKQRCHGFWRAKYRSGWERGWKHVNTVLYNKQSFGA